MATKNINIKDVGLNQYLTGMIKVLEVIDKEVAQSGVSIEIVERTKNSLDQLTKPHNQSGRIN